MEVLSPQLIKFSQFSVSDKFVFDHEEYQKKPILVVRYNVDPVEYCSHDNKRLASAKQYSEDNGDFTIEVELQDDYTVIDTNRDEYQFWRYFITFKVDDKGIYILQVKPRTYGALIALRCSRQGKGFHLDGSFDRPLVSREVFFRRSDFSVEKSQDYSSGSKVMVDPGDAYNLLESCLQEESLRSFIGVSITEPGQKFCNCYFPGYLMGRVADMILIEGALYYPKMWLKAAAEYSDEDDRCDREAAEYDLAAELDNRASELEILAEMQKSEE